MVKELLLDYSKNIEEYLESDVEEITVYHYFKPIDNLPPKLKKLNIVTEDYTHSLSNLPVGIKYFNYSCRNNIDHMGLNFLPCGITAVDLSSCWCYYAEGSMLGNIGEIMWPNTIKTIRMPRKYHKSLENLPYNLETLHIYCYYEMVIQGLPPNLKNLIFDYQSNYSKSLDNLPPNLEVLELGNTFNREINKLPNSLQTLKFCETSKFDKPINKLPPNLKHLVLGRRFNQSLDDLPDNLETLEIGEDFNQPIHKLPKKLRVLKFCKKSRFNHIISEFPCDLQEFHSTKKVFQQIQNFPNNVTCIYLDRKK